MLSANIVKIDVNLFLATLFILGALLYKDYGMVWYDCAMSDVGDVNIQYSGCRGLVIQI